jgi:hypothetical protein
MCPVYYYLFYLINQDCRGTYIGESPKEMGAESRTSLSL